jgi:hypothetical protein
MQTERTEQGGVTGAAHQAASEVADKAQQLGAQAGEQTRAARDQAASRMREQVDQRTAQAAEQASGMAQVARRVGDELRQQGNAGQARYADQAAEQVERLGDYLRRADADTLLRDIESFGRRQPMVMAAGGMVAGVLAARFVKASASRRSEGDGQLSSGYGQWDRDVPEAAGQRAEPGREPVPTPLPSSSGGW